MATIVNLLHKIYDDSAIQYMETIIESRLKQFENALNSKNNAIHFIERFKQENKQIAIWFKNTISSYLVTRGWFVAGSLYTNQYKKLKEAIEQNKETEIENFMIQHVRSITNCTASDASIKWPHRRAILTDAFEAHSNELYTLSVPAMLAQADGMALDILDAHLFTVREGKIDCKAKDIIQELKERPLAQSFVGMFTEESGLKVSTNRRDTQKSNGQMVSSLNRHGVLHGIDCDYPKECNSLRAIALINFLNWVHDITSKQNISL